MRLRLERAECRLLADCAAAAERGRPDSRAFVQKLAGGVATYTGPDLPFNKVARLGFADALDEARLTLIERAFAERRTPVQAEVAIVGDPAVRALVTRRGYVLENFETCSASAAGREPAGYRRRHRGLGRGDSGS